MQFKLLSESAKAPSRNGLDAGYDLYVDSWTLDIVSGVLSVHTGVAAAIPAGYFGLICDRSSVARTGMETVGGVIDAGYRGEIIILFKGWERLTLTAGVKIAQLVVLQCDTSPVMIVTDLPASVDGRGVAGFGSTDKA